MEDSPLSALIQEQRAVIAELEKQSIKSEDAVYKNLIAVNREKLELLDGIKARMLLIDMLKKDMLSMVYKEKLRLQQD